MVSTFEYRVKIQYFLSTSQYTYHMLSISQAWYIVKTLQVYFEQSDQENAGQTGLAHAK